MEKRCYKVKELQEILGLSRTSIYELLKRKEFQWVVVGGNISFLKQALMNGLTEAQLPETNCT